MRTLTDTLLAAQQASSIDPLVKIVLTKGASSYTYTRDRILEEKPREEPYSQKTTIILSNSDRALNDIDLQGFKGVISHGAVTKAGEEYSATAPLWLISQEFESSPGKLDCTLELIGIPNLMAEDEASAVYKPDDTDTKSVKTLINEIVGATLACYNHCTAYEVVWEDGYDTLADTYKPRDSFRVYLGGSRLAAFRQLIDYTGNVAIVKADGKCHIFKPTTSGEAFDYVYSLESGHTLFSKAYRNTLVIPNRIVVQSQPKDDPQYSGSAQIDGYNDLPDEVKKTKYYQMRLASNAQATAIAEAKLAKEQLWAQMGAADVPMNVGAEVFDYVKVTDSRQSDERTGNLGWISGHVNLPKKEWRMTFSFGNWMTVRKALAGLNISSDELQEYFTRLKVKDLEVENILAENVDFVWIDPDNTIDLSQIGDTLDSLPDGETYARVKTLHLDAGQIKLDENILYASGYDPTEKEKGVAKQDTAPESPEVNDFWLDTSVTPNIWKRWTGTAWVKATPQNIDEVEDGAVFQRAKSSALTTDGLVILDNVVLGTYSLVLTSDISAGHILLSKTEKDGEWYDESGVEIDATHGINIYGTENALTTRATKTGPIQCYVGADGKIYAGAGAISLDSTEAVFKGAKLTLKDSGGGHSGQIYIDTSGYLRLDDWITKTLHMYPVADSVYDLGYSSSRYGDLHIINVYAHSSARPWTSGGADLGGSSYYWGFCYLNSVYANAILPKLATSYIGESGDKWNAGYFDNLPACPVPTSNSALEVIKKIRAPQIMVDERYGERHYFKDEDFPAEMKRGEEIEFIRTVGVLVQSVRELTERVEILEAR